MLNRILSLSFVAVVALACADDSSASLVSPAPLVPTSGTVAYVMVDNPSATAGSQVTVTAVARQAAGLANIGAFSASLSYDVAGLVYVGESALPGVRAINPKAGEVLAAAASNDGFAEGKLFAVTFKVVDPAALASLKLTFKELAGTDFGNRLSKLDLRGQLYSEAR
jgi:hypothetical protein